MVLEILTEIALRIVDEQVFQHRSEISQSIVAHDFLDADDGDEIEESGNGLATLQHGDVGLARRAEERRQ